MPSNVVTKTGKISLLRVHQVETRFGPPNDELDAEVIMRFADDHPRAYGLQLRNDDNLPAAQAMFALLEDCFNANAQVSIDYEERAGRNHHMLFRVWRTA